MANAYADGKDAGNRPLKSPARLVQRGVLDPRDAAAAVALPIADAVNIPFGELPNRAHELPPRDHAVIIAGPRPLAERVAEWFRDHDRAASLSEAWSYVTEPRDDEPGRLWSPTTFLEKRVPVCNPATADALDLACGTGRDAVYLASLGWRVCGADVLPDALDRARALEQRYSPGSSPILWVCTNLERIGSIAAANVVFDERMRGRRFDLITCFRYLHRPLVKNLASWIHPGGRLLFETFTRTHLERNARPANPVHLLEPGELPTLLDGWTIEYFDESWRGNIHTARLSAVFRE